MPEPYNSPAEDQAAPNPFMTAPVASVKDATTLEGPDAVAAPEPPEGAKPVVQFPTHQPRLTAGGQKVLNALRPSR
jgi:hypothetical protein